PVPPVGMEHPLAALLVEVVQDPEVDQEFPVAVVAVLPAPPEVLGDEAADLVAEAEHRLFRDPEARLEEVVGGLAVVIEHDQAAGAQRALLAQEVETGQHLEAGLEDRAEEHTTLHRGLFRPQVPVQQVGEDEEVLRREAVLPHHLRERTTEAIRAEIASEPGNLAPRLRAQPRTLLATELRVA